MSVDRSTAVGERLWTALQQHPQDFVSLVIIELQQACIPATSCLKSSRARSQQPYEDSSRAHDVLCRLTTATPSSRMLTKTSRCSLSPH